ncbi:hypothetical protein HWI79_3051 [Cryptosporidium felis]|nr:hypothetical protein HWI79_3051 [Cryptosporidium felis]
MTNSEIGFIEDEKNDIVIIIDSQDQNDCLTSDEMAVEDNSLIGNFLWDDKSILDQIEQINRIVNQNFEKTLGEKSPGEREGELEVDIEYELINCEGEVSERGEFKAELGVEDSQGEQYTEPNEREKELENLAYSNSCQEAVMLVPIQKKVQAYATNRSCIRNESKIGSQISKKSLFMAKVIFFESLEFGIVGRVWNELAFLRRLKKFKRKLSTMYSKKISNERYSSSISSAFSLDFFFGNNSLRRKRTLELSNLESINYSKTGATPKCLQPMFEKKQGQQYTQDPNSEMTQPKAKIFITGDSIECFRELKIDLEYMESFELRDFDQFHYGKRNNRNLEEIQETQELPDGSGKPREVLGAEDNTYLKYQSPIEGKQKLNGVHCGEDLPEIKEIEELAGLKFEMVFGVEELRELGGLERLEDPEKLGTLVKLENLEKLEDPEKQGKFGDLEELEGLGKLQSPGKLDELEELEGSEELKSPEKLEDLEGLENLEELLGLEKPENLGELENSENLEGLDELVNLEELINPEELESLENLKNQERLENPEEMVSPGEPEGLEELKSLEKLKNLEGLYNPEGLESSEKPRDSRKIGLSEVTEKEKPEKPGGQKEEFMGLKGKKVPERPIQINFERQTQIEVGPVSGFETLDVSELTKLDEKRNFSDSEPEMNTPRYLNPEGFEISSIPEKSLPEEASAEVLWNCKDAIPDKVQLELPSQVEMPSEESVLEVLESEQNEIFTDCITTPKTQTVDLKMNLSEKIEKSQGSELLIEKDSQTKPLTESPELGPETEKLSKSVGEELSLAEILLDDCSEPETPLGKELEETQKELTVCDGFKAVNESEQTPCLKLSPTNSSRVEKLHTNAPKEPVKTKSQSEKTDPFELHTKAWRKHRSGVADREKSISISSESETSPETIRSQGKTFRDSERVTGSETEQMYDRDSEQETLEKGSRQITEESTPSLIDGSPRGLKTSGASTCLPQPAERKKRKRTFGVFEKLIGLTRNKIVAKPLPRDLSRETIQAIEIIKKAKRPKYAPSGPPIPGNEKMHTPLQGKNF